MLGLTEAQFARAVGRNRIRVTNVHGRPLILRRELVFQLRRGRK